MSGSCDNAGTVLMGEHVDKMAQGSYFLRTRSESPYAYQAERINNDI